MIMIKPKVVLLIFVSGETVLKVIDLGCWVLLNHDVRWHALLLFLFLFLLFLLLLLTL